MKFEYTHGYEVSCSESCNPFCVVVPRIRMSTGIYLDVGSYKSFHWNTVWLHAPWTNPSSVCSRFAISSNQLYPDELVRFASAISAITADVAFPDLTSVDRHYFAQILGGLIRMAIPTATNIALLNPEEFLYGDEHAVFSFPLSEIPYPTCAERRAVWLSDYSDD